jgi:hypothetical protein
MLTDSLADSGNYSFDENEVIPGRKGIDQRELRNRLLYFNKRATLELTYERSRTQTGRIVILCIRSDFERFSALPGHFPATSKHAVWPTGDARLASDQRVRR